MRITVAFEELGKDELPPLGEAFWLADIPAHRAYAESLWKHEADVPNSALFAVPRSGAPLAGLLEQFEQVEVHFPEWSEVLFARADLTLKRSAYFADRGFAAEIVRSGFVVRRSAHRA
ncbi:hypothetical protein [Leisingera daeponensis]|uniref:hypothetical protein n=1 Tax=Leisingera daeponensis TaxID=405746 RepID=UPI0004106CE9|nr:hypothetical protein [Leisingera daeponensis]